MLLNKNDNCLICGENQIYPKIAISSQCMFCGEFFYATNICKNGHYVCEECHMKRSLDTITHVCEKSTKKEAIAIAFELMMDKWIKMHGAEHPYLVAAVLLTAYKNRGYKTKTAKASFQAMLDEAKKRAAKIPANSCGYWGCSGEAIGAGIFASLVLGVSPMSVGERGQANFLTSKVLEQISLHGGPRCCKRESLIAILTTSQYTKENWQMPLTDFEGVECLFSNKNVDCIGGRCPFSPKQAQE